jgi:uncharacterized protein (DUF58 family)
VHPLPSVSAVAACTGGALALALAIVTRSPAAAVLAGAWMAALACAFALTLPLAARLRRERLEFHWWDAASEGSLSGGAVVAGGPFTLHCRIRNHGGRTVRLAWLTPVAPEWTVAREAGPTDVVLAPRARVDFTFRYAAKACGRVVFQGLSGTTPGVFGLFLAPLYFPSPLVVEVLPRAALRSTALAWRLARPSGAQLPPQHGFAPLRRPGDGSELRELREHRSGDPFKAIAWKASARAGKLIVREVEREVQETLYLVLDAGASMRGGLPGDRKLDHAIELVALAAREALDHGDRVGLVIADERVFAHVPAHDGAAQASRIHVALLAATAVVDADLTTDDDDAVAAAVARHQRYQGRSRDTGTGAHDPEALAASVAPMLPGSPTGKGFVAADAAHRILRAYCFHRGVALAHRATASPEAKTAGLSDALRTAAGTARARRTILVVTDFEDMAPLDALDPTFALMRSRGHATTFVFADPVAHDRGVVPARASTAPPVAVAATSDRFRHLALHLATRGITLVGGAPDEDLAPLLRRARAAARAA